jgi:hypothetical protein
MMSAGREGLRWDRSLLPGFNANGRFLFTPSENEKGDAAGKNKRAVELKCFVLKCGVE